MIRILHVLGGLDRGGAETMVMNLYRNIDRTQVQFDFITHTNQQQAYTKEIENLGGKIYYFPKFNGFNALSMIKLWKDFFKEHCEYKILHSHVRSYASLYLRIARQSNVKTIVHSHNTSNGRGLSSIVKRLLQVPLRYQADFYFACSKKAGIWLFGKNVVLGKKFYVLPNAIDLYKFSYSEESRNNIRCELNLIGKTVYGNIGRLTAQKNQSFLLDVFSTVYKKNKNAVLLIVGIGELENTLKEKAVSLGLKDSVLFIGARSDVPALLSAMDVFVFPSLWEGLPVTVIEAQASGIPCVVSSEITHEVGLSSLVYYLPVDRGTQLWSEMLCKIDFCRKDVSQEIKNAGYDIQYTSNFLTDFYRNL